MVLITGLSATEDRINGINAGADDFLSKPIDFNELLARTRSLLRLKQFTDELENAESVLFSLARSIEARDPYTLGHCERLSDMSARLGEKLGLPEEEIKALRRAGIVHDIGKVVVPDAILLKPGPLSPEEIEIMRKHPVVGERICAPSKAFRLVLPIIRHHHEKHDGRAILTACATARFRSPPLFCSSRTSTTRLRRIARIATPRPRSVALQIMEDEAALGWWDRELFEAFRDMIRDGHQAPPVALRGRAAS